MYDITLSSVSEVGKYLSEHSSVGRAPDCRGLRRYQAVTGSNPVVRILFSSLMSVDF